VLASCQSKLREAQVHFAKEELFDLIAIS